MRLAPSETKLPREREMVATRRTSLRLQEKATTGDCTLPSFTDDELTPTRARKAAGGDSATKKVRLGQQMRVSC